MQTRKVIIITSIVALAAICTAAYYFSKSSQLKKQINSLELQLSPNGDLQAQSNLKKLDSLIKNGNYEQSLALSKELRSSDNTKVKNYSELSFQLLSEIVALLKIKKPQRTRSRKDTVYVERSDRGYKLIVDSLDLALNDARSEIGKLSKRLLKKPSSDYLAFETSKGTPLHYVGNVKNNEANGQGMAILESGSRYVGEWKDNMRHGKGKFFWDDGEIYEGDYTDDKREGEGTYYWENGEKYTGSWKDDQRNGHGDFFNKKGKLTMSGIWKDDKLVEEDE